MMTSPLLEDDGRLVAKEPGERSQAWMAALGTGLLLGGLVVGIAVLSVRGYASGVLMVDARRLLRIVMATAVMSVATLLLHETLHGLGMLVLRARPRFGAGVMSPGLPYVYTTSEGHLFTRWQYIVIAALPNVLLNVVLLLLMLVGPAPSWWVIPFALHLSGGVGDMWLCWAAFAEPPGTRVEDRRGGIRVLRPDAS